MPVEALVAGGTLTAFCLASCHPYPLLVPLLSISQPVLNTLTPTESQVVQAVSSLEDELGLNNTTAAQDAQNAKTAKAFAELLDQLIPLEKQLAATDGAQCLVLFENQLAQLAARSQR